MLRTLFFRASPEQSDSRSVSPKLRSLAAKNCRTVENDREFVLARGVVSASYYNRDFFSTNGGRFDLIGSPEQMPLLKPAL